MEITLTRGGQARLTGLDGDRGTLDSDTAAAPGSRLSGVLPGGRSICLKVHRCVRVGERFVVEGRFIDLTREMRLRLAASLEG
jgi:hypothetical protein